MAGNYEAITREVAAETLREFTNNCVMPRLLKRSFEKYFMRGGGGARFGSSIDIGTAIRTIGADGQAFQPEGLVRQTVPLSVNYWSQESFLYNDPEEAMFLREDIKRQYIHPHAINLANKVDRQMLQFLQATVPNWVGIPGTAPTSSTALDLISSAQTKLNQLLALGPDRSITYNSYFNQPTVKQGQTLFNPQQIIGKQWLTGKQGRFAEFDIYLDEQIPSMTVGTYGGAGAVNGANQSGTSIATNGWTPGSLSLSQGPGSDRVTFAGCYEINLQSRLVIPGVLKQFTVVSPVVDTSGAATLNIYPALIPSGPYQNCSASPTSGGAVTVAGASGTLCQTAFGFQEEAFTWVPIELMDVAEFGAKCTTLTDPDTGISIRVVMQWDSRLGEVTVRMDFIWGIASTECDHKALVIYG